ncbi:MAG: hypothetical protein ACOYIE_01555 [Agathobaculum sp.]|jgi:hypothetical protein|uniref:hypothetical protein n=1 Tax=Agathobaculum sp. TaxID=2048138 RepID=UPI003D9130E5
MPWCPQCGAEFRKGFRECNTCHIPLIDHPPTEEERRAARPQKNTRFWNRERLMHILRALIAVLLALAAAMVLAGK